MLKENTGGNMLKYLGLLSILLLSNVYADEKQFEFECRQVLLENYSRVPVSMLRKCQRVNRLPQFRCIKAIATNYRNFPEQIMNACMTYQNLYSSDAIETITRRGFSPLHDSIVYQVGRIRTYYEYECVDQYVTVSSTINANNMRAICF